ncbi:MAG: M20 family metallopeptidase [Bacillota bacterium]|nr:M20 family metallopeptidase [Bacillota bacterium]
MSRVEDNLERYKKIILDCIDAKSHEFLAISHEIHSNPELGNKEFFASSLLVKNLESSGFLVDKNIEGYETAFIAKLKSQKPGPILGFLAEYDALPNLGHACGHNIIGTMSIAAAISLSSVINNLGGEIWVFGTPAEEGGENGAAKTTFVKNKLFDNVDACLMLHPHNCTTLTGTTLAVDALDFEFFGKAAHAAGCPEKGINALDGIIQLYNSINALRQHLTTDVKIHGIITHGGDAPNIIPEYAKARFFVRAATSSTCSEVTKKVKKIAEGSAMATGTSVKITEFQNHLDEMLILQSFDNIFKEIVESLGEKVDTSITHGIGSTDAGNVSQVVPTIHPHIKICNSSIVPHTKEFTDAAKSTFADNSLLAGAKALALTALTLLTDREKLNSIKEEFNFKKHIR